MDNLCEKLKKYTIKDAIKFEEKDRQFIALQNLEKKIADKELYLLLTLINAIICYQLS
jgi:N-glycosylase/DNA lyase